MLRRCFLSFHHLLHSPRDRFDSSIADAVGKNCPSRLPTARERLSERDGRAERSGEHGRICEFNPTDCQ